MSPVSACASKCTTDTRPSPCWRATPVTSARVIEWSPPSTTGIAPLVATAATASVSAASDRSMCAGRHLDVTGVEHPQVAQRVDPQREVRPGPVVAEVVGRPDRLRAEPGAGPVRGAAVERRPDDHHVGAGERRGVGEVAPVDPEEGDVRAEHGAVPGHDGSVHESNPRPSRPGCAATGRAGRRSASAFATAAAGQLDAGPAQRLRRERQRLAAHHLQRGPLGVGARRAGRASPARRTGWRRRRARCSRRRRPTAPPCACPRTAENREQVSMTPPQAWVNRSPSSCGKVAEEVLGQPAGTSPGCAPAGRRCGRRSGRPRRSRPRGSASRR